MTAQRAPRRWRLAIWLGLTSISMVASFAVEAQADGSCLPPAVKSTHSACTGPLIDRTERDASIRWLRTPERPQIEAIESLTRPQPPPSLARLFPPNRTRKLDARAMDLLRKEIAELQRLLRLTPAPDRERPELLRRVADRYGELATASRRDHDDYERRARRFDEHGQGQRAQQLLAMATQAGMLEAVARRGAIEAYGELDRIHPSWCRQAAAKAGGRQCGDDVLRRLARAHEHDRQPARALVSYERLLSRFPRSPYAFTARLSRAALSFDAAAEQPARWADVQAQYEQLGRLLPEHSPLRAYVSYQLAQTHWRQGQFDVALATMLQTLARTARSGDGDALAELGRLARRDAVLLYALGGEADRALEAFRLFTGSRTQAIELAESLGTTYWSVGHYGKAASLYRALLEHNGGPAACGYQERIARATLETSPHERAPLLAAVEQLLRTQRTFRALGIASPAAQDCTRTTARLLAEVASSWHVDATGEAVEQSGAEPASLVAAARVYRLLLDNFSPAELESVRWPGLGAPQRPVGAAIRHALAELRGAQGDWRRCGRAFDAVARDAGSGSLRDDAVVGAAECYERAVRDGAPADAAMAKVFERYLCRVRPPRVAGRARDAYLSIKVAHGRLGLTDDRVGDALAELRSVALDYADSPWGALAGQLYLDGMVRVGGDPQTPNPSCFDEAEKDIARLEALYCVDAGVVRNADHCVRISQVRRRLPWDEAAARMLQCERSEAGAPVHCRAAGELYRHTWEHQARAACLVDGPECLGSAGLLYHGARAFAAAGDRRQATALRETLADERYHLDGTELAQRALLELADDYRQSGAMRKAVQRYERFVSGSGDSPNAPLALVEAIRIRLALGEQTIAARHVHTLVQRYGAEERALVGEATLLVAESYGAERRWAAVLRQLAAAGEPALDRAALDVQVRTHALRGRAEAELGHTGAAERAYGRARNTWADELACLRKLAALGGDDAEQAARKDAALAAVAESLLFLGDLHRQRATREPLPPFQGRATRGSVERHVNGAVAKWLASKRRELRAAAAAYDRVLELGGGHPPPHYAWLAREASASLWGEFVLQLRAAPHPRRWNRAGQVPRCKPTLLWAELRASYREMLWARSLPFEARAASANAQCVTHGKRLGRSAAVRACEQRLTRLVPEAPGSVERVAVVAPPLRPAVPLRPAPVGIDGRPLPSPSSPSSPSLDETP